MSDVEINPYMAIAYAKKGDIDSLRFLLDRGVDVNIMNSSGNTPLIEAVHDGHYDCVRLLLEKGANHDLARGWKTAFLLAAEQNHIDIICLFLEAGYDIHEKRHSTVTRGNVQVELSSMDIANVKRWDSAIHQALACYEEGKLNALIDCKQDGLAFDF